MVVDVGLTLTEPVGKVEEKEPGEMEMFVAPVAAQASMLLAPELMLVGFATKEVIAGLVPLPVVPPEELTEPQPERARQTPSEAASAQKSSRENDSALRVTLFAWSDLGDPMRGVSGNAGTTILVSHEGRAYWPQVQKRTVGRYRYRFGITRRNVSCEKSWLKRPALHGRIRRAGESIVWGLKGIAGRLRKRVEK